MRRLSLMIQKLFYRGMRRAMPFIFGEKRTQGLAGLAVFMLIAVLYLSVLQAPASFPKEHIFKVESGMTLEMVAQSLKEEDIVRSPFLLRSLVIIFGGERSVYAGDYYFERRQGVFNIAYRLANGLFDLRPVVVRIPEGTTIEGIAEIVGGKVESFDKHEFLALAKGEEGYLFPDTYFLPPNVTPVEVFSVMKRTFDERVRGLEEKIQAFGVPFDEVVIMASLIEREAHNFDDKRKIAGVLWNRIEIGMPLQVDAVFFYILGKDTAQVLFEDLEVDSPYNTYKYAGLPPGPISNPGLASIEATVTPIESDYFYYLADRSGVTHFSKTFEEHKQKRALYLN